MPQLEVTAMTFGPFGVGHLDGKTVMVPNVAPGDLIEVEVISQKRGYSVGQLKEVLKPGPFRRLPPCRFLPRCGGCDLQQIEYAAQVRLKAQLIAAEFLHGLGIQLDEAHLVEPAPSEFGYRSRIRLKTGVGGRLGFHQLGSNSLVPIDRCMVAVPSICLPEELVRPLGGRCQEVEVVAAERGQVVIAYLERAPRPSAVAVAQRIVASDRYIAGIVLRSEAVRQVVGEATIKVEIEPGLELEADADLFSQVNRDQNLKLVASVMEMAAVSEGSRVLDLFSGAGNFSLPAARRGGEVIGVDNDEMAAAAARRNAVLRGFRTAQFLAMRASETAQFLRRAHYQPSTVIIDPPRVGAPDLMDLIADLRPQRLVYVSCDPSTLVRDLRIVSARGYQTARVQAFDFFPNTHHVEVAVLALLT